MTPSRDTGPWDLHARALLAHLAGDADAAVTVLAADGEPETVAAAHFFRGESDMAAWEHVALAQCRGRVLDVGCGAGSHALLLAERGHAVVALDVSAGAAEVARARGVADARTGTLADVDDGPYDTLLLLMHGIGIARDLPGLAWLLADAHRLTALDGRVVLDSRAPDDGGNEADPDHGSVELRLASGETVGPPFRWLFVTDHTLARIAENVGWRSEVVHRDPDGRYVAVLHPQQER